MAKETKSTAKTVKTEKTEKVEKVEKEIKNPVAEENEMLKAQIAEMKEQLALLSKAVINTSAPKVEAPAVNPNRSIRFINLKNCTIVLKAAKDAPAWKIAGRYNYIDLPEREAHNIAVYMSNYLRKGSVYIDDAQFVADNGLDAYYATLLSDKDLKELLDNGVAKVVETYKSVNDNQKEVIIEMILDKCRAGEKVDYNILAELGRLSGKDLINFDND